MNGLGSRRAWWAAFVVALLTMALNLVGLAMQLARDDATDAYSGQQAALEAPDDLEPLDDRLVLEPDPASDALAPLPAAQGLDEAEHDDSLPLEDLAPAPLEEPGSDDSEPSTDAPPIEQADPGIVIGGAASHVPSDDPAARLALLRELVMERERASLDDVAEDELTPEGGDPSAIVLDDEAFSDEPRFEPEERVVPEVDIRWDQATLHVAHLLLAGTLAGLLLLLFRRCRDLRLAFAGAILVATTLGSALDLYSWITGTYGTLLSSIVFPLPIVALALVVLSARRHRRVWVALLLVGHVVPLIPRELFMDAAAQAPTSSGALLLTGAIAGACIVLRWGAVAATLLGHARETEPTPPVGAGPYRSASAGAPEDDDGWAPRAVLHAAIAWLVASGSLRLTWWDTPGDVFAIDVGLAIAATIAASRIRARDARRVWWLAAGLFSLLPLLRIGNGLHRALSRRSLFGLAGLSAHTGVDSFLVRALMTACFAAAVGAALAALRATGEAHARATDRERVQLRPIEIAVMVLGAAQLPWLVAFEGGWAELRPASPILLLLVLAGAYVLRRYLLRLSRWFEDSRAAGASARAGDRAPVRP